MSRASRRRNGAQARHRVLIIIIIMLVPRKLNGATRRGTANCEDLVSIVHCRTLLGT